MKIKILCTLGPASNNARVLGQLDERGVDLFRINLSHTSLEALDDTIGHVREHSDTPICLDTEGAQVRCGPMLPDVVLNQGDEVCLTAETVMGNASRLTLWPETVFEALSVGSVVGIDFDGVRLRVVRIEGDHPVAVVVKGGRVRSNKGATVDPAIKLPALSEKDVAATRIGAAHGLTDYALSFASSAEDVAQLRSLAPPDAHVIAKIESRAGVQNMDSIIPAADAILIDRGDLSRDVPLELIPYYQKAIIRRANRWHRPVYVATNLLESMVTSKLPTIAEANDIATTLLDGVHGLVLAAETAIGVDPAGSVDILRRAMWAFERADGGYFLEEDRPRLRAVG
jgi:pyruvate kinase